MDTLRLICLPTSGRGSESPAERWALAAFRKDRLRFAHPTRCQQQRRAGKAAEQGRPVAASRHWRRDVLRFPALQPLSDLRLFSCGIEEIGWIFCSISLNRRPWSTRGWRKCN